MYSSVDYILALSPPDWDFRLLTCHQPLPVPGRWRAPSATKCSSTFVMVPSAFWETSIDIDKNHKSIPLMHGQTGAMLARCYETMRESAPFATTATPSNY